MMEDSLWAFQDFVYYFETATICKVHDDYYYVATPIRHNKNKFSARNFVIKEKNSLLSCSFSI